MVLFQFKFKWKNFCDYSMISFVFSYFFSDVSPSTFSLRLISMKLMIPNFPFTFLFFYSIFCLYSPFSISIQRTELSSKYEKSYCRQLEAAQSRVSTDQWNAVRATSCGPFLHFFLFLLFFIIPNLILLHRLKLAVI